MTMSGKSQDCVIFECPDWFKSRKVEYRCSFTKGCFRETKVQISQKAAGSSEQEDI